MYAVTSCTPRIRVKSKCFAISVLLKFVTCILTERTGVKVVRSRAECYDVPACSVLCPLKIKFVCSFCIFFPFFHHQYYQPLKFIALNIFSITAFPTAISKPIFLRWCSNGGEVYRDLFFLCWLRL